MPTNDTQWTCPTCGHNERQPAAVTAVCHACPHKGRRPVELVAERRCGYCTHTHDEHMHNNPRRLCRRCMCVGYEAPQ